MLLVDEAYFHFHGETVIDLIGDAPNLVVARTFSKAYGLAGLRLGLLAGSVELMRWVRRVLSPYSVNSLALACLPPALEDTAYLDWYVSEVLQARAEFEAALDTLECVAGPAVPILFWSKSARGTRSLCANARCRRAGARPLQRSGLRWPGAHHHRHTRTDEPGGAGSERNIWPRCRQQSEKRMTRGKKLRRSRVKATRSRKLRAEHHGNAHRPTAHDRRQRPIQNLYRHSLLRSHAGVVYAPWRFRS